MNKKRARRTARSRAKVFGTSGRPRLAVFRSNRFTYAQLINDEKSHTVVQISSRNIQKSATKKSKTDEAHLVGELLAKKALELGIKEAIFDRRFYKYHGRVKGVAEGARKGGLKI